MNDTIQHLFDIGEPLAAGLLEYPEGSVELTYCRGYRRYLEHCPIVYREGAPLFPSGHSPVIGTMAVYPCHAHPFMVDWNRLEQKSTRAAEIMREYTARFRYVGDWNHSMLNYKRILAEGIDRYEARLLAKKESNFRTALLDLIEGIRMHKFTGVGLDVCEEESNNVFEDRSEEILEDSTTARLLSFPNVMITSHQGFFTKEALTAIAETTLLNTADYMAGRPSHNDV